MTEKYGECRNCRGMGTIIEASTREAFDCPRCGGTGFDGSFEGWAQQQQKIDQEKEREELKHDRSENKEGY
jgi:hypothetical protein